MHPWNYTSVNGYKDGGQKPPQKIKNQFLMINFFHLRKSVDFEIVYLIITWKFLSVSGFTIFHRGLGYETQKFPF